MASALLGEKQRSAASCQGSQANAGVRADSGPRDPRRDAQAEGGVCSVLCVTPGTCSGQQKASLSIVPIANGVCSACGMQIPVSQVHAVHAGDILSLPSCARYLFFPKGGAPPPEPAPEARRARPGRHGPFSAPSLMITHLAGTDRDEAIAELCGRMGTEGFVDNAAGLTEEALRREAIASTSVDHGLAFPHVRGVEGGGLTLALGLSRKGIRFDGTGKNLTRIVFLMVIPTAASAFYLRLLVGPEPDLL